MWFTTQALLSYAVYVYYSLYCDGSHLYHLALSITKINFGLLFKIHLVTLYIIRFQAYFMAV